MPPDVKHLLDQLKAQAEALGLPQDGKDPSDEPSQAGEDKAPKKLPPQLNPLLAKLARAAARENDQHAGRTFSYNQGNCSSIIVMNEMVSGAERAFLSTPTCAVLLSNHATQCH